MVWLYTQKALGRTSLTNFTCQTNGKRPVERPRTRWTNSIEDRGWNRLGLYPSEMMDVVEDHEVWRLNLELLISSSHGKAGNEKKSYSQLPHLKFGFTVLGTV